MSNVNDEGDAINLPSKPMSATGLIKIGFGVVAAAALVWVSYPYFEMNNATQAASVESMTQTCSVNAPEFRDSCVHNMVMGLTRFERLRDEGKLGTIASINCYQAGKTVYGLDWATIGVCATGYAEPDTAH